MPDSPRDRFLVALPFIAAGCLVLTMWAAIASGLLPGRMASDQLRFHEVVVRLFREQWPDLNLRDYRSATTPGYHLVIAACSMVLGDARALLQHAGSLFTLALLVLLARALASRRRADPAPEAARASLTAAAMVLVFGSSLYVWPAGVWLLPDNAGWLFVLAALLLALRRAEHPSSNLRAWCALSGLAVLALVCVRQIHLWVAAPLLTAAWLAPGVPGPEAPRPPAPRPLAAELARLTSLPRARATQTILLGLCLVPAVAAVAWFARLWGGLTPPLFQAPSPGAASTELAAGYAGVNLAAPAFVLALLALFTPFFAAGLPLRRAVTGARIALLAGALAGLALALIAPTTYDKDAGRWTGLWNITRSLPALGGRTSILIAALSTAGGVCVVLWALALPRRVAWVLLAALVGFMAAQSASHQLWQRYCEPLVLLLLILASWHRRPPALSPPGPALTPAPNTLARAIRAWSLVGPLTLALGFAALTANALHTSPRQDPRVMDEALASERARLGGQSP